jgi:hypothetical protein
MRLAPDRDQGNESAHLASTTDQGRTKAAVDCRSPRRWRAGEIGLIREASWTAAALCRFSLLIRMVGVSSCTRNEIHLLMMLASSDQNLVTSISTKRK